MLTFLITTIFIIAIFLNEYYKRIVIYHTQEEEIKRGSKLKQEYEIVAFGSSYCRYAFDFSKTKLRGFNFGIAAQFLYYTDIMIRAFRNCYKKNAFVLIILPDLVFGNPGKGKYYPQRYIKFISKKYLSDEYSVKEYIFQVICPLFRPSPYYIKKALQEFKTYKKVHTEYLLEKNPLSLEETKLQATIRCKNWINEFHLKDTISEDIPEELEKQFVESRTILTNIIKYCLDEGLRPALVITPVSDIMNNHLSEPFLKKVLYNNINIANKHNIPVLNYIKDKRFQNYQNYVNTADFLNAKARKEFSEIVVKDIIKEYSKKENAN